MRFFWGPTSPWYPSGQERKTARGCYCLKIPILTASYHSSHRTMKKSCWRSSLSQPAPFPASRVRGVSAGGVSLQRGRILPSNANRQAKRLGVAKICKKHEIAFRAFLVDLWHILGGNHLFSHSWVKRDRIKILKKWAELISNMGTDLTPSLYFLL